MADIDIPNIMEPGLPLPPCSDVRGRTAACIADERYATPSAEVAAEVTGALAAVFSVIVGLISGWLSLVVGGMAVVVEEEEERVAAYWMQLLGWRSTLSLLALVAISWAVKSIGRGWSAAGDCVMIDMDSVSM